MGVGSWELKNVLIVCEGDSDQLCVVGGRSFTLGRE